MSPEARGEIRVRLFARTDVGQVREHNEDNFLVADLTRRQRGLMEANRQTTIGPQGAVFAVCDGMGGAAAGEIASQLAVDILCEKMIEGLDDASPVRRDDLGRRLAHSVGRDQDVLPGRGSSLREPAQRYALDHQRARRSRLRRGDHAGGQREQLDGQRSRSPRLPALIA